MATKSKAAGAVGERGQRRRTLGGRLARKRPLRGVALIALLVLALAASLALGRALQPDRASMAAGSAASGGTGHAIAPHAPPAACVYASADGTPGEGCGTGRADDDAPQP